MQEEISALCEIFYDTIQIPASMHHPKDVDRPGFRIRLVKQDIISNQFFPDPCLRNITILHQGCRSAGTSAVYPDIPSGSF